MTKLECLEKQRDMAYHNLMCYSKNVSMTIPKEGQREEWNKAKEECIAVEELINMVKGVKEEPLQGPAVIDGERCYEWKQALGLDQEKQVG